MSRTITRADYLAAFETWFRVVHEGLDADERAIDEQEKRGEVYPWDRPDLARRRENAASTRVAFREAWEQGGLPELGTVDAFCAVLSPRIDRYTEITIAKSSFLYRVLYLGEPLRTVRCPVHQGHWSGAAMFEGCECGGTGWLRGGPK